MGEDVCEWCGEEAEVQANDNGEWLCAHCYTRWEEQQQAELDEALDEE